jgi:DNA ligase-1
MDGIRAYWDGKELLSRNGKKLNYPPSLTHGLPSTKLDGELWMGRASYDLLAKLIHSKDVSKKEWANVAYYVFDLPESKKPYEARLQELQEYSVTLPPNVHVVSPLKCDSLAQLQNYLDSIMSGGGEGIMAQQPGSFYTAGFTSTLLKVKVKLRV